MIAFMRQSENQIISVQTSLVLLAVGRTPELDDLSLDLAGVQVTDEGIEIGRDLCTSNPQVYACGQCANQEMPVSSHHQASIAARNALFFSQNTNQIEMPLVI